MCPSMCCFALLTKSIPLSMTYVPFSVVNHSRLTAAATKLKAIVQRFFILISIYQYRSVYAVTVGKIYDSVVRKQLPLTYTLRHPAKANFE